MRNGVLDATFMKQKQREAQQVKIYTIVGEKPLYLQPIHRSITKCIREGVKFETITDR